MIQPNDFIDVSAAAAAFVAKWRDKLEDHGGGRRWMALCGIPEKPDALEEWKSMRALLARLTNQFRGAFPLGEIEVRSASVWALDPDGFVPWTHTELSDTVRVLVNLVPSPGAMVCTSHGTRVLWPGQIYILPEHQLHGMVNHGPCAAVYLSVLFGTVAAEPDADD